MQGEEPILTRMTKSSGLRCSYSILRTSPWSFTEKTAPLQAHSHPHRPKAVEALQRRHLHFEIEVRFQLCSLVAFTYDAYVEFRKLSPKVRYYRLIHFYSFTILPYLVSKKNLIESFANLDCFIYILVLT
jgi:hypothetical protein